MVNAAKNNAAAPLIYKAALGSSDYQNVTYPADPIQSIPTYSAALGAFEKIPRVRILFDNGAGKSPNGQSMPGDPYPAFTHYFSSIPVPGTKANWWYFGAGGRLASRRAAHQGINWYTSRPNALPNNDYTAEHGDRRPVGQCLAVDSGTGSPTRPGQPCPTFPRR